MPDTLRWVDFGRIDTQVSQFRKNMAELLVSVRSPQEARAALAGGASIIDVKDPTRGSLGRACDATIAAIVRSTAGRRPVSAAMGELVESLPCFAGPGLTYLKWGLAGCGGRPRWRGELGEAIASLHEANASSQAVAVAYADWRRAGSPLPEEVCAFACSHACGAFLLDTWQKDGSTLLDWLSVAEVSHLCQACRSAGVRVALAGSLGAAQILRLRASEPDWFAVRGAVCEGGRRDQSIAPAAVRRLATLLKITPPTNVGN
jgi:uncharacterized protein (UPF0264 family)